jgi:hypothetical protein
MPPKAKEHAMRTAIALATLLISSTAFAGPASDSDADASAQRGAQSGTTVYDFEDDDVDGEILSPDGANISSRGRNKHASLISVRPHFIPELIEMALDI